MAGKERAAGGIERQRAAAKARPRVDPERLNYYLIVGGVGAVIALVILLLAFGYYQTQIAPGRKVVLEVEGTKITRDHLSRRIRMLVNQNPGFAFQRGSTALDIATVAYDELRRDALVIHGAARDFGIYVGDAEIDDRVRVQQSVPSNADPRTFAAAFRQAVQRTGLTVSEFRFMTRADIAEQRVRDELQKQVPASALQANFRLLRYGTEEQAKKAAERIRNGEDVVAVAKELFAEDTDPSVIQSSIETGWVTKDQVPREARDIIFDMSFGQVSDPIPISDGTMYAVYQLIGKEDNRPIADEQRPRIVSAMFDDWVAGLRDELSVRERITDDDKIEAVTKVQDDFNLPGSRRRPLPADPRVA
ncbi:MAG TPA: SurA N-terminal domain-containing protein [Dehalococcoidia bacterium]|nr:SurA N-terminal domain-containing protein [Dehalococcoidia bacterium]